MWQSGFSLVCLRAEAPTCDGPGESSLNKVLDSREAALCFPCLGDREEGRQSFFGHVDDLLRIIFSVTTEHPAHHTTVCTPCGKGQQQLFF